MGDAGERPAWLIARRVLGAVALLVWGLVFARYGVTVVRGGSMEPALAPNDVVIYRRGGSAIAQGDIVLFDHEGWPGGVLHRVRALEPGGLLQTQGDANPAPDRELVPRTRVRGVVCGIVPIGRWGRCVGERFGSCAILNRQSNTATR
ncbi:MAG: signal peptidase I [Anaerosomatales bacterium]|nr:signal peptidase I [Anaerosomatales bacterium]